MFASRELKRANSKFSKSKTPNASFTCKTRVSRLKCRVHHTRVWRTWDLDFEVNELMFYQVIWKARLQSRDAWIPGKRFQREIKRKSLFMDRDYKTFERPSFIMAKASSYPKKNSLEVGLHLSRHGLEVGLHLSRHGLEVGLYLSRHSRKST